jgi:catechol 2,3-dioxygenase-like lactoylglutathione lyase family enzyme
MTNEIWAALVPELICSDIHSSKNFYCNIIGFSLKFERPEEKFLYLEMGGAQIMLEEKHQDSWMTGRLAPPFGRGINLQIEVQELEDIFSRLQAAAIAIYQNPKESWYRENKVEHGQVEMLVQDPDGYLLRFVQILGTRQAIEPCSG